MKQKHFGQKGISLLELLLVVLVLAVTLAGAAEVFDQFVKKTVEQEVAIETMQLQTAAENYVDLNFPDMLLRVVAVDAVDEITIAELITNGFLPPGYTPTSSFKQTMRVFIRRANDAAFGEVIEVLTLSQGPRVDDRRLFSAAGAGDAKVGVISCRNLATGLCNNTIIRSAAETWEVPLADFSTPTTTYSATATEAGGYMASYGRVTDEQILTDQYLFRVDDPSFPDANIMQTNLDMNNNSIENADIVVVDSMEVANDAEFTGIDVSGIASPYVLSVRGQYRSNSLVVTDAADAGKGNVTIQGDNAGNSDFNVNGTLTVNIDGNAGGTGSISADQLTTTSLAMSNAGARQASFGNLNLNNQTLQSTGNIFAINSQYGETLDTNTLQVTESDGINNISADRLVARSIDVTGGGISTTLNGFVRVDNTFNGNGNLDVNNRLTGSVEMTITDMIRCEDGCP